MTWLTVLLSLIRLVAALVTWARDNKLVSEGQTNMLADALKAQGAEIEKANAARAAQRARDADGVQDDTDPFRRD